MKKYILSLLTFIALSNISFAQSSAKAVYAEIGGPGLASLNYDMRFKNEEAGLGFRVGLGGFSLGDDGYGSKTSALFIPVGLNYLIGKDQKNYFEVGAGFTYVNIKDTYSNTNSTTSNDNFATSFGNLTLGYRLAPAKGGFFFKAEITPVFGKGFFIPYYGGIGFGYKF